MYLNCHSFHSLRYGTIPLPDLIQQGVASNVKAIALTDINTVTGIYDFTKACNEVGIKPLVGIEFRSNNQFRYIGLAKNALGIAEMNRFLTKHNFENTTLPFEAPEFKEVFIIYHFENVPTILKENEYIGIRPEQLIKLYLQEWKTKQKKMVILQPVTFRTKKEFNLHKKLQAIDTNIILSMLNEDDYCKTSEKMPPVDDLLAKYE